MTKHALPKINAQITPPIQNRSSVARHRRRSRFKGIVLGLCRQGPANKPTHEEQRMSATGRKRTLAPGELPSHKKNS